VHTAASKHAFAVGHGLELHFLRLHTVFDVDQ
jgi:hypothetical protein